MSNHDEFFKYSKEQIINALFRFKISYPASYKAFFLSELEKPYSPFDREIIFLSEEDEVLLKKQ